VAGNTVIFVPGPLEDAPARRRGRRPTTTLVATLSEASTWKRQGDYVSFIGTKPLRFHLNTN